VGYSFGVDRVHVYVRVRVRGRGRGGEDGRVHAVAVRARLGGQAVVESGTCRLRGTCNNEQHDGWHLPLIRTCVAHK